MTATSIAMTFIDGLLTSDAGLSALIDDRIFDSPGAAEGEPFPYVMVSVHSATPKGGNAKGQRACSMVMLLIKVITEGTDFTLAESVFSLMDAVIQDASGTAGNGKVSQCELVKEVRYPEVKVGEQYCHMGGLYKMWVSRQ